MRQTYSIVIQPSPSVIAEMKQMKELLFQHIGWYPSKNALAHITVNEFEWEVEQVGPLKKHIASLTRSLKSRMVCFDHLDSFPNGALFWAPDTSSKEYLKDVLSDLHKTFAYKTSVKSSEPHLSIGRKIPSEQLKIAFELFAKHPNLTFLCDRLALRVFNTERKQFDLVDTFLFGEEEPQVLQQKLF